MSLHKTGLPGLSQRKVRFVAHALGMSDLPSLPAALSRDLTTRPTDTCALAAAFSEVQTAAEKQMGFCMSDGDIIVMGNSLGKRRAKVHLRGEVSIALTKALSLLGLSEYDRASISSVTLRPLSGDAKLDLCIAPVRSLVVAAPLGVPPQGGREETGGIWWHSCDDGESLLGPFIFALQSPSRKAGTVLEPHTVIPGRYSSGGAAGASLCPLPVGAYYLFRPPNLTYADSRSPSLAVLEPRRFFLCTLCFSDSETAATCSIQLEASQKPAAAEPADSEEDGSSDGCSPSTKKRRNSKRLRQRSLAVGRQTRQRTVRRAPLTAQVNSAAADASPACDQQPSPPGSPRHARRLAMGVVAHSTATSQSRPRTRSPSSEPPPQVRGRGVGGSRSKQPAAVSDASDGVSNEVEVLRLRGRRR